MPLIRLFFDIALFKKGPQDVPASRILFGLAILAYSIVGFVLLGLDSGWLNSALQVLVELLMLLAFTWATLAGVKLGARFLQTSSAMLGSDALISSLASPILLWMGNDGNRAAGYMLLMLLMLWQLGVIAHILRHALTCPLTVALVLAIVYIAGSYQIMLLLFGPSV